MVYLLFEFWRLEGSNSRTNATDTRSLKSVYFLVSRGTSPNATLLSSSSGSTSNDVSYMPPRASSPQSGQNGTLMDPDADVYWRPYHRVITPVNASITYRGSGDWFVTVANLDSRVTVPRYAIRVTCVTEATAPCPTPSFTEPPCNGQGQCVAPPASVERPGLNKVCSCAANWGDYGCQRPAPTLSHATNVSAVVPAGGWAFFQLRVPLPAPSGPVMGGKPALLVELYRGGPEYGGDPVLVVMPKDGTARATNRVPWFSDITRSADLRSFFLQQNFHYLLQRDLVNNTMPGTAASAGGGFGWAEYYVAVYNNDQRFGSTSLRLDNPLANITLQARWRTDRSGGSALCPSDCSWGTGACYDPWDPLNSATLPPSLLPAVVPTSAKPSDFMCYCKQGFGGTMCEGSLRNLTLSSSGDGVAGEDLPLGSWAFFLLSIDPRRFNYAKNDMAIQWLVRDASGEPPSSFVNAFLTIDENAFPRDAQLDSDDPFRRGWQIFYRTLAERSQPPQPLQVKGSDLKPGLQYVLAVYNSDYLRQQPYRYSLAVYVPGGTSTWLHPYMSVVLGVTASVVLCLFMTLCRRVVQRYGWGPWRGGARDAAAMAAAGQGGRGQMGAGAMLPRPVGVPGHVVESFHTYSYTASKAEKAQLARSRRDHNKAVQDAEREADEWQGPEGREAGAVEMAALGGVAAMAAAAVAASEPPAAVVAGPTPGGGPGRALVGGSGGVVEEEDEPQCTVCLCEYEEGERIMQLPCKHEFHATCINKWMQTHYTCPICRVSLLPANHDHHAGLDHEAEHHGHGQPPQGPPEWQQGGGGMAFAAGQDPLAAAEAGAAGPAGAGGGGLVARMLGSMRRAVGQQEQQQQAPGDVLSYDPVRMAAAPAPAELVARRPSDGVGTGGAVVAAVPASGAQLLAVGPSAGLDGGSGYGAGSHHSHHSHQHVSNGSVNSGLASGSGRSGAVPSPSRSLAAGRTGSPPVTPLSAPPGALQLQPAPAVRQPRDTARELEAVLRDSLDGNEAGELEEAEPPGMAPAPARRGPARLQ